jgi:LAO/AO transport system kinase
MTNTLDAACAPIFAGDQRAAARLISRIEAGDRTTAPLLQTLYAKSGATPVIGITGPPGAGKSTLADQLVAVWRAQGFSVAVLAVDPSSPITGGSLLGDRVRMGRHNADRGVFIRSMAARGRLGGLAGAAGDALIVLGAMGFSRILVETVGTGQNEIDILNYASSVVIVQTPAGGDAVQAMKSGMLEIGEIFAVNKADLAGADRTVAALRDNIEFRYHAAPPDQWVPPVLKTNANSGSGVAELDVALTAHTAHYKTFPAQQQKHERLRARGILVERLSDILRERHGPDATHTECFEQALDSIIARAADPYSAALKLLSETGLA